MNVSDKAQDAAIRVRKLLEQFWVECQSGLEHDYGTCANGCKNSYVPDHDLDGLRELVEEPCEGFRPRPHSALCACHSTQKLTRDWTHSLSGSLYGAALERLPLGWAMIPGMRVLHTPFGGFPEHGPDHDLAIMEALEAALTAQLEAANAG